MPRLHFLVLIDAHSTPDRRAIEAATREGQSHVGYLEALLTAEMEERESRAITRLLREAKPPRMKTLDAFEFDRSSVSAAQLRTLAEGDYVAKAEPILLVGEADTGKTHLATGLCVAACRRCHACEEAAEEASEPVDPKPPSPRCDRAENSSTVRKATRTTGTNII